MPLIKLHTSDAIPAASETELMTEMSTLLAEAIGKPEKYVMVTLDQSAVCMSGQAGNAALAEVRSIGGLGGNVRRDISKQLCGVLQEKLSIPSDRVYINFVDVDREDWGWDGTTFG